MDTLGFPSLRHCPLVRVAVRQKARGGAGLPEVDLTTDHLGDIAGREFRRLRRGTDAHPVGSQPLVGSGSIQRRRQTLPYAVGGG